MRLRTERLFVAVIIILVIFWFFSTFNRVSVSEEGFTSASGFQETDDDGIGNNAIFGGNVGIGTMNPQAKLHISGSPGVDGILFPDGTLQTTAAAVTTGLSNTYWQTENPVIYNTNDGIEITRMEFRCGVKDKYLQIYGIWIVAEDVMG